MTTSRYIQALFCASTFFFLPASHALGFPHPLECVALPNQSIAFNQVDSETVKDWIPSLQYVINPEHLSINSAGSGDTSMRQRFVPSAEGSIRISAAAHLEPATTYELRQQILFEQGFDWGGVFETGKIGFGLGGGTSPSGGELQTDGFTVRLIWQGNNDGAAKLGAYVYSADRTQNIPYGDVFLIENFDIPTGEWLEITLAVTTNSSLSVADGTLTIGVNDEFSLVRDNILWQSTGEPPQIEKLTLASFYGGNTDEWSPDRVTYAQIRDVCYLSH